MKSSEILRRAARLCEQRHADSWCIAVAIAQDREWHTKKLEKKMHFVGADNKYAYQTNAHRIVSLCLAAAIAESEGD